MRGTGREMGRTRRALGQRQPEEPDGGVIDSSIFCATLCSPPDGASGKLQLVQGPHREALHLHPAALSRQVGRQAPGWPAGARLEGGCRLGTRLGARHQSCIGADTRLGGGQGMDRAALAVDHTYRLQRLQMDSVSESRNMADGGAPEVRVSGQQGAY